MKKTKAAQSRKSFDFRAVKPKKKMGRPYIPDGDHLKLLEIARASGCVLELEPTVQRATRVYTPKMHNLCAFISHKKRGAYIKLHGCLPYPHTTSIPGKLFPLLQYSTSKGLHVFSNDRAVVPAACTMLKAHIADMLKRDIPAVFNGYHAKVPQ